MNIAIVLMKYNPFGGYERQAAILAEALADRGDMVTVFANEWTGEGHGRIRFQRVPMIKWTSWLKVLSFALMSRRYLLSKKENFDAIIAFDRTLIMDIYRAGNACHKEWMAFRRRNGRLYDLVSMTFNPLHTVINKIEGHIFSSIQKRGGKIVVLSITGKEQIKRHYPVDEDRFAIIPPCINFKKHDSTKILNYREETRKRLGIEDDTLLLLHMGSGFRIKGLSSTIESLSILITKGVKSELIVAGADRTGSRKCREFCKKLGVEKYVHFLGGVKDVERIYAAADIFVMPSLFETFGVSVVEALSFGLPVIIGRGAGVSHLIERENAGMVIDVPSDPKKLADIIHDTSIREEELKASGKIRDEVNRRRVAALKCSRDAVIPIFLSLIDQVVKIKNVSN
jgi:UDP-glucose:(heptosyl)LPS alpha-1,3-glucosyltransferase